MTFNNTGFKIHGDAAPPVDDKPLTEARVNEIVNGALKRIETQVIPSFLKPMEDKQTQFMTSLEEKLSGLTAPPPDSGDKGDKKDHAIPPELNQRLQEMERQRKADAKRLEQLEEQRKQAEAKANATDKESKIRAVLNEFNFVSKDAQDDLFSLLDQQITRSESGELISSDNLPYDAFIRDFVPNRKAHFLAPTGKGGSGASTGNTRTGADKVDMSEIKPGMSPESMARVAGAIRVAIQS